MIEPESKFREKYRVPSNRLKGYDYSSEGVYFITICTKNCENYFGEIVEGKMVLNEIGKVADRFLREIPDHFQNVSIGEYVIMPNHVHIVIMIGLGCSVEIRPSVETRQCLVSTSGSNPKPSRFQNQGKGTISAIVGSYKSICTKTINTMQENVFFAWQPNYHDHIIRDEDELNRIRQYIVDNPLQWEYDEDYRE
ncbi:MAG: transposase [Candidatus Gracilibacteria bacterium]|nr:transposase [Candidatus Gracilibacteria bacterium]